MSKYDVEKIRAQMRAKQGGKSRDPQEFRPPTAEAGKVIKYRFFILAPLDKGDKCEGGKCSRSMENMFCVENGSHWIERRPHSCPRVNDSGDHCEICTLGFDLMSETDDAKARSKIAKSFLPPTRYMVNIYFPDITTNPEELRGKIYYYNAPKQCYDIWEECLYRDEAGDADDPSAYSVFYDEERSYLFQLEVRNNGNYNEYKTSKFLVGKNAPSAIAADEDEIQQILDARVDLWSKIDPVNKEEIIKIATMLKEGSTGSGFDDDENDSSTKAAAEPAESADNDEAPALGPKTTKKSKGLKPSVTASSLAEEAPVEEAKAKPSDDGDADEDEDPELSALLAKIKK